MTIDHLFVFHQLNLMHNWVRLTLVHLVKSMFSSYKIKLVGCRKQILGKDVENFSQHTSFQRRRAANEVGSLFPTHVHVFCLFTRLRLPVSVQFVSVNQKSLYASSVSSCKHLSSLRGEHQFQTSFCK